MKQTIKGLTILFCATLLSVYAQELDPGKRTPFTVPLAKLSLVTDTSSETNGVRISLPDQEDYALIFPRSDSYLKYTRYGREKTIFQENDDHAGIITEFEAEQIDNVCKTMVATLEKLESDIGKKKWDRCLYLDGYFPRFLQGLYYLYNAARDSTALPASACVPDTAFEVSLYSMKSDYRIDKWRTSETQALRVRIAAKELIEQIKVWQKKELENKKRDPLVSYGEGFEKKFIVFVRAYFNRK